MVLSALSLSRQVHEPLHLYVLSMNMHLNGQTYQSLRPELLQGLQEMLNEQLPGSTIRLFDTASLFEKEMPGINLRTRFTPYCMLRLFADCIDEIPERILYLDTDVLCRKDPMPFYEQSLEGVEMAGVLDNIGKWFFHRSFHVFDYFNSGVLLLNMKEIRKSGLFERSRQMCMEKRMFMPDQSALNKNTASMRYWPRKWNEQGPLRNDTVFQHFTTRFGLTPVFHMISVKPWEYDKVHDILQLQEYDALFEQADALMALYPSVPEESK